ncbi:MAG: M48 family metalloprotease [Halanaerobiales bacterium]
MWKLINLNKRKTIYLFLILTIFNIIAGYGVGFLLYIGAKHYNYNNFHEIGLLGAVIAFLNLVISWLFSYYSGDNMILSRCNAQKLKRDNHPQLFNIVEELCISANLNYVPDLYATPSLAANAFAVGIKKEKSSIVITTGLLKILNRNQIQGVLAHELAHIINRDTLYLTFAGSALMVKNKPIFGDNRHQLGNKGSGLAALVKLYMLLIYIVSRIIYFSLSRNREYLADATAIRLTRYPEGLASALEKINSCKRKIKNVNYFTAPLYINNPLTRESYKTHPPIDKRIKILRNITREVSYEQYQNAYNYINKNNKNIIPVEEIKKDQHIPIKEEKNIEENNKIIYENTKRDFSSAKKNIEKELFKYILCKCGTTLKMKNECDLLKISCPNCGSRHNVSEAELTKPESPFAENPFDDSEVLVDIIENNNISRDKNHDKWLSIFCECGHVIEISPMFSGNKIRCNDCGKIIHIKNKTTESYKKKSDRNKDKNTYKKGSTVICECGNKIEFSTELKKEFIRCWQCDKKLYISDN